MIWNDKHVDKVGSVLYNWCGHSKTVQSGILTVAALLLFVVVNVCFGWKISRKDDISILCVK